MGYKKMLENRRLQPNSEGYLSTVFLCPFLVVEGI